MTKEPSHSTQEKINQLQLMEQNMQSIITQKQNFQSQLTEVENALSEMETSKTAYKIIGNFMFATEKNKLKTELKEKEEMLNLRISTMQKQEQKLKDKAKEIQQDVLAEMKK